ncbi:hypothetical protein [Beihai octopus virus 2]|uniref:hypothetical protein n=1 Tax=Beihai octopus virus 2 TaxID=1922493 RepID=UPI00090C9547|nr:hypothetical protein [Beihai octopus virus 2]APG78956.1 hypothetical protein [Beihai octopus virus 2]
MQTTIRKLRIMPSRTQYLIVKNAVCQEIFRLERLDEMLKSAGDTLSSVAVARLQFLRKFARWEWSVGHATFVNDIGHTENHYVIRSHAHEGLPRGKRVSHMHECEQCGELYVHEHTIKTTRESYEYAQVCKACEDLVKTAEIVIGTVKAEENEVLDDADYMCRMQTAHETCNEECELLKCEFQGITDQDDRRNMAQIGQPKVDSQIDAARGDLVEHSKLDIKPFSGDIGDIVSIPSRVYVHNWPTTDSQGKLLFDLPIDPTFCKKETVSTDIINYSTNLSYFSDLFTMWRGNLKFDVEIVSTQYHQGQLMVVWVPVNSAVPGTLDGARNLPSTRIDISEMPNTAVEIPYISNTPYKGIAPSGTSDDKLGGEYTGLGRLAVYVLSPLTNIDTIDNNIDINVYLSAGKDFELKDPERPTCTSFTVSATEEVDIKHINYQSQTETNEFREDREVKPENHFILTNPGTNMHGPELSTDSQMQRQFFFKKGSVAVGDKPGAVIQSIDSLHDEIFKDETLAPHHMMSVNKYVKTDLEVELRIPPTRFHQGMLVMYFVPTAYEDDGVGSFSPEAILNFPNCKLNLSGQTSAKLTIPYCGITQAWSNGSPYNLEGALHVVVWNQMKAATGSSTSIDYTLWIRMCNTTVTQAIPYAKWQGEEETQPLANAAPSTDYGIGKHDSLYNLLKKPDFLGSILTDRTKQNRICVGGSDLHSYITAPFCYTSGGHKYHMVADGNRADNNRILVNTSCATGVDYDPTVKTRSSIKEESASAIAPSKPVYWLPQENNQLDIAVPQYHRYGLVPTNNDVDASLCVPAQILVKPLQETKPLHLDVYHSVGDDFRVHMLGAPRITKKSTVPPPSDEPILPSGSIPKVIISAGHSYALNITNYSYKSESGGSFVVARDGVDIDLRQFPVVDVAVPVVGKKGKFDFNRYSENNVLQGAYFKSYSDFNALPKQIEVEPTVYYTFDPSVSRWTNGRRAFEVDSSSGNIVSLGDAAGSVKIDSSTLTLDPHDSSGWIRFKEVSPSDSIATVDVDIDEEVNDFEKILDSSVWDTIFQGDCPEIVPSVGSSNVDSDSGFHSGDDSSGEEDSGDSDDEDDSFQNRKFILDRKTHRIRYKQQFEFQGDDDPSTLTCILKAVWAFISSTGCSAMDLIVRGKDFIVQKIQDFLDTIIIKYVVNRVKTELRKLFSVNLLKYITSAVSLAACVYTLLRRPDLVFLPLGVLLATTYSTEIYGLVKPLCDKFINAMNGAHAGTTDQPNSVGGMNNLLWQSADDDVSGQESGVTFTDTVKTGLKSAYERVMDTGSKFTPEQIKSLVKIVGMGILSISTTFAGVCLPRGVLQSVLQNVAGRSTFDSLSEGIKYAQNFISDFFDDKTDVAELDTYLIREKVFDDVVEFYKRRDQGHFRPENLCSKIDDSKLSGAEFLIRCKGHLIELDSHLLVLHKHAKSTILRRFLDDLRPMLERMSRNSQMTQSRVEPVGVWMAGGAGCGKSLLLSQLIPAAILQKIGVCDGNNFTKHVYSMPMNPDQKYYDGYNNQMYTYYDDFSAVSDGTDYGDVLQFISTGVAPLNMASLEDKGRVFTSDFVCVSSNESKVSTKAFKFKDPFKRRFPFAFEVEVDDAYAHTEMIQGVPHKKLNAEKLFSDMGELKDGKSDDDVEDIVDLLDNVWSFHEISLTDGRRIGPYHSFSSVVGDILGEYEKRRKGGRILANILSSVPIGDHIDVDFQGIGDRLKNWWSGSRGSDEAWLAFYNQVRVVPASQWTHQKFEEAAQYIQIDPDERIQLEDVRKWFKSEDPESLPVHAHPEHDSWRRAVLYLALVKLALNTNSYSLQSTEPCGMRHMECGLSCSDGKCKLNNFRYMMYQFPEKVERRWVGFGDWLRNCKSWLLYNVIAITRWSLIIVGICFLLNAFLKQIGIDTAAYRSTSGNKPKIVKASKVLFQGGEDHGRSKLRSNIVQIYDNDGDKRGMGVLLDQYHVVMNKHVFEQATRSDNVIKVQHLRSVMHVPTRESTLRCTFDGHETDTMIVRLPKAMPRAKKITDFIPSESQLLNLPNMNNPEVKHQTKIGERTGYLQAFSDVQGMRFLMCKGFDAESYKGECGTPYDVPYRVCTKFFWGIHSAEAGSRMFGKCWLSSPITKEMVDRASAVLSFSVKHRHVEHVTLQGDELVHPGYQDLNTINDLGHVSMNGTQVKNNTPTGSSKVKSVIHSQDFWPDDHAPAPITKEILFDRFKVYDREDVQNVPRDTYEWCLEEYWRSVDSVKYDRKRRVLTEEEVLNFNDSYPSLNVFDRNSSAGWWNKVSEKKKGLLNVEERDSGNYFTLADSEKHPYLGKTFKEHIRDQEESMKNGNGMLTLWNATLKDELRPMAKVIIKRTRQFQSGGFDHSFLCKKYFGAFGDFYRSNPGFKLMHGIGNDKESCWGYYYKTMKSRNSQGFDIDSKDYGVSIGDQPSQFMQDIAEKWYAKDAAYSEESAQVRAGLLEAVRHSLHVVGDHVMEVEQGNNDGFWLTDMYNSLTNIFYMMACFAESYRRKTGVLPPQDYFLDNVLMLTYGDDVIVVPSAEVSGFYNRVPVMEYLSMMGITATSAKKDDTVVPLDDLSELTFLKSAFEVEGSVIRAPMPKEVIYKELNWYKSTVLSEPLIRRDIINGALADSFHRGREFYDRIASQIRNRLKECDPGIADMTFLTYDQQYRRVEEKQSAYEKLLDSKIVFDNPKGDGFPTDKLEFVNSKENPYATLKGILAFDESAVKEGEQLKTQVLAETGKFGSVFQMVALMIFRTLGTDVWAFLVTKLADLYNQKKGTPEAQCGRLEWYFRCSAYTCVAPALEEWTDSWKAKVIFAYIEYLHSIYQLLEKGHSLKSAMMLRIPPLLMHLTNALILAKMPTNSYTLRVGIHMLYNICAVETQYRKYVKAVTP